MSDIDNDPLLDDAGDDLFGDDSNVGSPLEERERMLSDVELNEDDDDKIPENDESAYDARARDYSDDDDVPRTQPVATTKQRVIMDKTLYRHRLPKCPDNKVGRITTPTPGCAAPLLTLSVHLDEPHARPRVPQVHARRV
jgi:hypothetical protein